MSEIVYVVYADGGYDGREIEAIYHEVGMAVKKVAELQEEYGSKSYIDTRFYYEEYPIE